MTTHLYWRPDVEPEGHRLPDALRHIFEKQDRRQMAPCVLAEQEIPYVEGLRDAGVEGADELLVNLQAHGRLRLSIR